MEKRKGYIEGTCSPLYVGYAKIYALADEFGNVFYVGITTQQISARVETHLNEARNIENKSLKNQIIRFLEYKIVVTIVDQVLVTGPNSLKAVRSPAGVAKEKEWIIRYKELGYDLTNYKFRTEKHKSPQRPEAVGNVYRVSLDKDGLPIWKE